MPIPPPKKNNIINNNNNNNAGTNSKTNCNELLLCWLHKTTSPANPAPSSELINSRYTSLAREIVDSTISGKELEHAARIDSEDIEKLLHTRGIWLSITANNSYDNRKFLSNATLFILTKALFNLADNLQLSAA